MTARPQADVPRGRDGVLVDLAPDPESGTPLYLQLSSRLRAAIDAGRFRGGDALPSERELSDALGLSRVTVRKAIEELARSGLVVQRHGAGTFVAERLEQPLSLLLGFTEDMRARGLPAGSVWLEKASARATPEEAMALGLPPADPVVRLLRIRTAGSEPMAVEQATVPCAYLPSPDLVGDSLYEAMRARGFGAVRALQRLRADLATAVDSARLGIPEGAAVLNIERRAFLEDGRPVELTRSVYRADRYDFVAELRLPGERRPA
jgi:GntR family transcriptional regulator